MSILKKKPAAKAGAKAKKSASALAPAAAYDVIVRPVVTEKSTQAAEQNKVVFAIAPGANKQDVKRAVESIFNVTVTKVNTIQIDGKRKRFRGQPGQRSDVRKAVVTLAAGQSIDVAAGTR